MTAPTDNPMKRRRAPGTLRFHPSRALFASKGDAKATATWQLRNGFWMCLSASKRLRWMIRMSVNSAKAELTRRKLSWHWIENSPKAPAPPF